MALGVSVAVATEPTFSLDGEAVESSVFGIQWTNDSNGSFTPQTSDGTSLVGKRIILVFNGSAENSGANGDTYDIKASSEVTNFTLTSTTTITATSIELRPSKVSSPTGKITTLDLSGVTSGYALVGDFKTGGGSGNTNIGKFGGQGIQGNVTLDGSASTEMYFTGSAGITGTLTISQNGTNTITFENGTIGGATTISNGNNTFNPTSQNIFAGGLTISGGTTTLLANGNKNINDMLGTTTLSGGTLAFGFAEDVENDNKIFNFNTSKQVEVTTTTTPEDGGEATTQTSQVNQLTITGGTLAFNGAKKVYFNNSDTTNQGDGTLTLTGGAVKFIVDPTITTANDNTAENAFLKGNITSDGGSVIFALNASDDSITGVNPFTNPNADSSSLSTYYVDGNITINSGGLSAFWDDSKGFVGKIATTNNHTLTFTPTNGLSGKNDVWFDSGTFKDGSNTISSISATTGTSHLVFEDVINIGTAPAEGTTPSNVITANGGSSMILFKNTTIINGNILSNSGNNNLYFNGDTTTINGNINTQTNRNTSITFNNGQNTINGNIATSRGTNSITLTQGSITINGNITSTRGNTQITFTAGENSIIGNIQSGSSDSGYAETGKYNQIAFGGTSASLGSSTQSVTLKADNSGTAGYDVSSLNTVIFGATTNNIYLSELGTNARNMTTTKLNFNALSFNNDENDNGEKQIASINTDKGNNIIGKNIASASDNSGTKYGNLYYSSNLFDIKNFSIHAGSISRYGIGLKDNFSDNFVSSDYTASGTFTFGNSSGDVANAIVANGSANNYINVSGTTTIYGNILINNKQTGGKSSNLLALTGDSATLGAENRKISVKITNSSYNGAGYQSYGNNTLLLGADINTLHISELSVDGDWGSTNPHKKTFNALSFNQGTNSANIAIISSSTGNNFIGKNIITQDGGYNANLFSNTSNAQLKDNFASVFVSSDYTANGTYTLGSITANGKGNNLVNISGNNSITGDILVQNNQKSGAEANNLFVLTGNSATLGTEDSKISIKITNSAGDGYGWRSYGNNTLLLGASTNTLYISELSIDGDFGSTNPQTKTFNALSFNQGTNSANITTISSSMGSNIIGKNIITQDGGYNTNLFSGTTIKGNFASTFMSSAYTASGTFTLGTITANSERNYINVENLTAGAITASGGSNYIYSNGTSSLTSISASGGNNTITLKGTTNTISGNILAKSSTNNYITLEGSSNNSIGGNITSLLGSNKIVFNSGNNSITGNILIDNKKTASGANNLFVLTGNSATLGAKGSEISIKITNLTNDGYGWYSYGNNTLLLGADTNTLYISELSVDGDWGSNNETPRTFNALSFNQGTSSANITTISSSRGNNIIGKNIITQDGGYNTNLFSDTTIKGNFASTFMSSAYTASGTFTLGTITANSGGANYINVENLTAGAITASGGNNHIGFTGNSLVSGDITKPNGTNNFTYLADNSTLTLQGATNRISTLTAVSGEATNKDTLIIDTSTNANATSIDKLVNGGNLIVSMKGATNSATLTLNNTSANSTLKALNLTEATSDMDKNILNLQARTTTILDEVNIASGKGLTINLNGTSTTLELDNGLSNSGNANISFEGSNGVFDSIIDTNGSGATTTINIANNKTGTIKGNITQSNDGANNVVFSGGTAKLTLQGSSNALNSVDSTSAGTLSLNSSNASTTTIAQLKGNNLTANFGGTNQATKLVIADSDTSNKTITLAGVSLEANSTNNTLDLTSLTSATISSAVSVNPTQGLSIALGSTDMTFTQGLSGSSVLSVSGISSFTTTSNDIQANTLNLMGNANAKATFKNTTTTLSTLNANAKGGNTLALDSSSNNVALTLANAINGVLDIELSGSATYSTTLTLNGGVIQSISATNGTSNAVIFSSGNSTINNAINSTSVASGKSLSLQVKSGVTLNAKGGIDNSSGGSINMELENNSKLYLGATSSLSSLTANNAVINIANMEVERPTRAITRNTLTIGKSGSGESYKGNAEFIIYVGGGQADNIVFNNVAKMDSNTKSSATITATGSYYSIINGNHTLVATVNDTGYNSTDGSTDNMNKLQGGEVLVGGSLMKTTLIEESDGNGVVKYYLGKGVDEGAPIQYQEVASSALTVNYDLFLANFNSLNKRMGELRESEHSNGVWARVFGGNMSNDFGSGSKTDYLTAQAGYDYSLSIGESARNFMGIAVAYGTSSTQGNTLSMDNILGSSGSIALSEVDSHMIEVGLYNSYVSDSGWYNDTIFKFDYIMSKFSLSNKTDLFTDTSNFAMVLSDEFGYRYKFGESEKGSWYIDPQVEVAFGYFNQSDFNRAMYDATGTIYDTTMRATQDTILTLRTRAGASLGKKFTTDKGFASLYVGAFYEYDYINGGNASVEGQIGGTIKSLDSIESNGRAVLNVGSNIELTKGARMYIDVEKSFGDKQRTFMQFNLGARYSF
ncbi:autotransporter outer membrane beta-barrel domain-containing protein [Helicobacter brantae]|uniref:Autotransporter domain-containing protein n=1 Tax=Helicobacter brantae TaxID=375927 RepID=A0A3D8J096_9HELI|nr:autotransporter outer membrane beta-barrel domain-containing protein [Helicobacter brantae]RDU70962.1 hypothetical protein CQA58_04070 [Helicobacter brantae]